MKKLKKTSNETIYAPVQGEMIPLEKVEDEIFSSKAMGEGVAFKPANGKIVSPLEGTVEMIANTKHAIGLKSNSGAEILIHIGMDTVAMNGEGFDVLVKVGQKVKVGDELVHVDLDKVHEAGYSDIIPMVITNGTQYSKVENTDYSNKQESEEALLLYV